MRPSLISAFQYYFSTLCVYSLCKCAVELLVLPSGSTSQFSLVLQSQSSVRSKYVSLLLLIIEKSVSKNSLLQLDFNLNAGMSATRKHYSVSNILGLVEDDKLEEFCCEGSDDEVSDLEM